MITVKDAPIREFFGPPWKTSFLFLQLNVWFVDNICLVTHYPEDSGKYIMA